MAEEQLNPGDRAHDGDLWFRVITNPRHCRAGTLHHSALKGTGGIGTSANPTMQWKSELSGRLRSLAGTIDKIIADAERRVSHLRSRAIAQGHSGKEFAFVAVAFVRVREVSTWSFVSADVIYDPIPNEDEAHASLVFLNRDPAEMKEGGTLDCLCKSLSTLPAANISELPAVEAGGSVPA